MSTDLTSRPVVVGYDGSATGLAALEWALDEAHRRDRPVRVVLAVPVLYEPSPLTGLVGSIPDDVGQQLTQEARRHAARLRPDVVVQTATHHGGVAAVLVDASRDAELVVVGRGRHRVLGELFVGSTSAQVIAHARCPVVVVEPEHLGQEGTTIVAGIDGSPESQAALGFAIDTAARRGASLLVVHAWWVDYAERFAVAGLDDDAISTIRQHEDALLTEAMSTWSEKYPDVEVHGKLVRALPADAIIDSAQDAALIVVGSRGHGGFTGLALGSVSQGLLHRPRPCPLVVVHAR